MRPQPMIAVRDVPSVSAWYQRVLGCRSGHGGDQYDQLVDGDRQVILQLHHWEADEHPFLGDPASRPYGNGVLLWFEVMDFHAAVERARVQAAEILEGPKENPLARHLELWLRDPEGYTVVLSSRRGEV